MALIVVLILAFLLVIVCIAIIPDDKLKSDNKVPKWSLEQVEMLTYFLGPKYPDVMFKNIPGLVNEKLGYVLIYDNDSLKNVLDIMLGAYRVLKSINKV